MKYLLVSNSRKYLGCKAKSSCLQMFVKLGVLKNSAIFTWKHLCWSLFLIKLLARGPGILLKIDFSTGIFLWILRFLWILSFTNSFFYKTPPVTAFVRLVSGIAISQWKLKSIMSQLPFIELAGHKIITNKHIKRVNKKYIFQ